MTCGEGLKCNHNRRYLVLSEIVFGLASANSVHGGRATEWGLGAYPATRLNQTPNTVRAALGVRLRGIIFVVERETTRTIG